MADEITHASGYTGTLNADAPEGTPALPLTATGGLSSWTGVDPADEPTRGPSKLPPVVNPPADAPGA